MRVRYGISQVINGMEIFLVLLMDVVAESLFKVSLHFPKVFLPIRRSLQRKVCGYLRRIGDKRLPEFRVLLQDEQVGHLALQPEAVHKELSSAQDIALSFLAHSLIAFRRNSHCLSGLK
jgi:hypothetical protein